VLKARLRHPHLQGGILIHGYFGVQAEVLEQPFLSSCTRKSEGFVPLASSPLHVTFNEDWRTRTVLTQGHATKPPPRFLVALNVLWNSSLGPSCGRSSIWYNPIPETSFIILIDFRFELSPRIILPGVGHENAHRSCLYFCRPFLHVCRWASMAVSRMR